jgi:hypothetical protein
MDLRQWHETGDEDDEAIEHLLSGDGIDPAALLILRGHHVATLAALAPACARRETEAAARDMAATVISRLRFRGGRQFVQRLLPFGAELSRLRTAAATLRERAANLDAGSLDRAIVEDEVAGTPDFAFPRRRRTA